MKSLLPKLLVACLIVGVATPRADAGVIFDNFGAGDAYNTLVGASLLTAESFFGDRDVAMPFTTPNDSPRALQTVEAAFSLASGPNELDVWIMSDVAGDPGVILETFLLSGQMGPFGSNNPPVVINSAGTVLQPNTQYWVAASAVGPEESAVWNYNSTSNSGTVSNRTDLGPWNTLFQFERPVMRVTVTPEPSTYILIATSALCIVAYSWRRKRKMAA